MAEDTTNRAEPFRRAVLDVATFMYTMPLTGDRRRLRATMIDDDPWFVTHDVTRIVRWNVMTAVRSIDKKDNLKIPRRCLRTGKTHLRTEGNDDAVWFVSAYGLHDIAYRMEGNDARPFTRWITHEVIPTMRAKHVSSTDRADLPMERRKVVVDEHRKPSKSAPQSLYRLYDSEGNLLYVGISLTAADRLSQHRSQQSWWHKVASVTLEQHPDRAAVQEAERLAIQTEHPRYNIVLAS